MHPADWRASDQALDLNWHGEQKDSITGKAHCHLKPWEGCFSLIFKMPNHLTQLRAISYVEASVLTISNVPLASFMPPREHGS